MKITLVVSHRLTRHLKNTDLQKEKKVFRLLASFARTRVLTHTWYVRKHSRFVSKMLSGHTFLVQQSLSRKQKRLATRQLLLLLLTSVRDFRLSVSLVQ